MISFVVYRHWPPTIVFTTLNCWFYWDFHNHSSSYLQSDDTLTSLYLLVVEMPRLFVSIFHPNIDFCVHTFGLCLKRYNMQVKGLGWTLICCLKQYQNVFLCPLQSFVLWVCSPCWPVRAVWSGLESCFHFQTGHWPQRCHWASGHRPGWLWWNSQGFPAAESHRDKANGSDWLWEATQMSALFLQAWHAMAV